MPSTTVTTTRGRISLYQGSTYTGESKSFLFNPPEITDEKQINWGTLDVPGASHPIYQFGGGGERIISFDLYLDGDRGYQRLADQSNGTDISGEVDWYQSLLYPSNYNGTGFNSVYPYSVLLRIGQLYRGVPCVLKGAAVTYKYFKNDMTPVRATLAMKFGVIAPKSVISNDVLNGLGNGTASPFTGGKYLTSQ